MSRYELIAERPVYRKRHGLFRDTTKGNRLSAGIFMQRVEGLVVGHRTTAPSKKQALELAAKVLAGGQGVTSVLIRNLDNPKESFRVEVVKRKAAKS
ncbi:MAG: hypothetical protein JRN35_09710 [Nitrososphaerota archaeon]|nr:hypothetical protein [Nitrososphaerota archaeon]